MSEIEKATPRPWRITWCDLSHREVTRVDEIVGPDGDAIVETDGGYYDPTPADAALIVEAVNAYDALRLKLTSLEKELESRPIVCQYEGRDVYTVIGEYRAALEEIRKMDPTDNAGIVADKALSHPTKTGTEGAL